MDEAPASLAILVDLDVLLWSEYDDGYYGTPTPAPSFSFASGEPSGRDGNKPAAALHHCWLRPGARRFLLQLQLLQPHVVTALVSRCSCYGACGSEQLGFGADLAGQADCSCCARGGMEAALRVMDPDGQCFGGRALLIQPGSARRLTSPGSCEGTPSDGYSGLLCLLPCGEDVQPPSAALHTLLHPPLGCPEELPAALCRHASQLAIVTSSCRDAYGTLAPGVIEVQPYCREYGPYDDLLDTLAAALVGQLAPAAADAALYGVPDTLQRLGLSHARLAPSPVMQALCAQALVRAAPQPPAGARAGGAAQHPRGAARGALQAHQLPALRVRTHPAGCGGGGGGGAPAITSVERLSGASRRALSPSASLPPIPELPSQEVDEAAEQQQQQQRCCTPCTPAPQCYTPSVATPPLPHAQRSRGHLDLPARASPVSSCSAAAAAAAAAAVAAAVTERASPPLAKPPKRRKGWGALSFATARVAAESGGGGGLTAEDLAAAAACLKQLEGQPPASAAAAAVAGAMGADLRGSDALGWRPKSFPSAMPSLTRYRSLSGKKRAAVCSRGSTSSGARSSFDGSPVRQHSALEAPRPPSPLTAAASAVAAATSRLLLKLLGAGGRLRRSQQQLQHAGGGGCGPAAAPSAGGPCAAAAALAPPCHPDTQLHPHPHLQAECLQAARSAPGPPSLTPAPAHGIACSAPSAATTTSPADVVLMWPHLALPAAAAPEQLSCGDRASPGQLSCADRASPGLFPCADRASPGHLSCADRASPGRALLPATARAAVAPDTELAAVGALTVAGTDAQLAVEAVRIASHLDELLTAHAQDPALAMQLTRPLYRQAMAAARGVRDASLRAAVREAVRRHVDPRRGGVEEALASVWALAASSSC
ncbi:hypothetical protein TSOC_004313 [Tetrabaena socialis]|uniref:Uncharacterized protein n=1 Tax=Tetrabaena socialis TaxID=47790 RepID=A0A2J8A999_9CHLO|nr:hypothetical protein TSOC_004313 [Tetrabaena socialis]|eukprot:PNH09096.1 hypothetical protein TSOC_004313 [Tetrabaena socialis]